MRRGVPHDDVSKAAARTMLQIPSQGRFFTGFALFRENIVKILQGSHRALESALSITGIVAFECALVAGVLLALHIEPGL